jgi:hypothetical protein
MVRKKYSQKPSLSRFASAVRLINRQSLLFSGAAPAGVCGGVPLRSQ